MLSYFYTQENEHNKEDYPHSTKEIKEVKKWLKKPHVIHPFYRLDNKTIKENIKANPRPFSFMDLAQQKLYSSEEPLRAIIRNRYYIINNNPNDINSKDVYYIPREYFHEALETGLIIVSSILTGIIFGNYFEL